MEVNRRLNRKTGRSQATARYSTKGAERGVAHHRYAPAPENHTRLMVFTVAVVLIIMGCCELLLRAREQLGSAL